MNKIKSSWLWFAIVSLALLFLAQISRGAEGIPPANYPRLIRFKRQPVKTVAAPEIKVIAIGTLVSVEPIQDGIRIVLDGDRSFDTAANWSALIGDKVVVIQRDGKLTVMKE